MHGDKGAVFKVPADPCHPCGDTAAVNICTLRLSWSVLYMLQARLHFISSD